MKYNRYEIIEELGHGAMGIVYLARDPHIDRMVALKVLRKERMSSEDYVQRFLKEAVAVGRLSHPGIVMVYDIGRDHKTIYIAMEYLEGTPFDELMAVQKFTFREVIDIGIQAANALDYAHKRGVVHRDIKPSNIIYTPDKLIKITDFGIAHVDDSHSHKQTMPGEMLGTPLYMSPEQIAGQGVDGRSDIFSLCVILYELTTGRRPFIGENITAIFRAIADGKPQTPHETHAAIPLALSEIIMKGLGKFPDSRQGSGAQLVSSLENVLPLLGDKTISESATVRMSPNERIDGIDDATVRITPSKGGFETKTSTVSLSSNEHDLETHVSTTHFTSSEGEQGAEKSVLVDAQEELPPPVVKPTDKLRLSSWALSGMVFLVIAVVLGGVYIFKERVSEKPVLVPLVESLPVVPDKIPEEDVVGSEEVVEPVASVSKNITQPVKTDEPTANDAALLALLQLQSSPQGADIYIDGSFMGKTPFDINLHAAKYEVRLKLLDHLDYQAQLDLRKGGVVQLTIPLQSEH
ncbi:MAG: protein kinase [Desulfobulbaceae bacterium]|nr:protein kinase [Desulfobulbaceae bacterium]